MKHVKALELGADEVFTPGSATLTNLTERRGKPLDAVIDAVGHESIINAASPLIKLGGSHLRLRRDLGSNCSSQQGSRPYNFNLYVHQWPTRRRERAAMEPLCAWIREGKLKAAEFITHEFALEQIGDALVAAQGGLALKSLLRY